MPLRMADTAVKRQGTLDKFDSLGDLPDVDWLTPPVDDYFSSYVAELGARGQFEGSSHLLPATGLENFAIPSNSDGPTNISFNTATPGFVDQSMTLGDLGLQSLPPVVEAPLPHQVFLPSWRGLRRLLLRSEVAGYLLLASDYSN